MTETEFNALPPEVQRRFLIFFRRQDWLLWKPMRRAVWFAMKRLRKPSMILRLAVPDRLRETPAGDSAALAPFPGGSVPLVDDYELLSGSVTPRVGDDARVRVGGVEMMARACLGTDHVTYLVAWRLPPNS